MSASVHRSVERLGTPTDSGSVYRSYERTNERTNERLSHLPETTSSSVTRTRTYGFSSIGSQR